ncbi:hypothetical protein JMN11_09915 [Capnocytophaga genosp. AHN8471]|nr:hypothetical protein [Capnocytophaga genosp. AHN8471]
MNLFTKNIKRNAYIVVICYIILVCFYNVFNHITKLGMPELHSFSLEGIQNLIGTFAIPMMLLFESYRHGDWVLNTINKLLTIAPFLFYILLPIVLKKKTSFNSKKYFLTIDVITFVIYGFIMLPTLTVGCLSAVIAIPAYIFMLYYRNQQYKKRLFN